MRAPILPICLLSLVAACTGTGGAAAPPPQAAPEPFTPLVIHSPSDAGLEKISAECSGLEGAALTECVTVIMAADRGTESGVRFTRLLEGRGFATGFVEAGAVDMARYVSPLAPSRVAGYALLTPTGGVVDLGGREVVSRIDLGRQPELAAIRARHPNGALYAANYDFPRAEVLPDGGQRFVFDYVVRDGCATCPVVGSAEVALDFDPAGVLRGVEVVKAAPRG